MELPLSPSLPPPSDPALHEDWHHPDPIPAILPSSTFSDELEAVYLTREESIARKNREGQVIQHRAWKVAEAFRSDSDYPRETPLRKRSAATSWNFILPSSPPPVNMPALISSPIAYPLSSSPVGKRPAPAAAPLRKPRAIGGFLDDDSDEENDSGRLEPAAKRRMLNGQKSPTALAPRPFEGNEINVSKRLQQDTQQTHPPRTIGGFLVEDDEEELGPPGSQAVLGNALYPNQLPDCLQEPTAPARPSLLFGHFSDRREIRTCSGKSINVRPRPKTKMATFEELVAARSTTKAGRAKKSYYGIDIHQLIDDAVKQSTQEQSQKSKATGGALSSIEQPRKPKGRRTMMWTEKYRARRFFDLVGDDRTHREVLRWLKGWDPIVFPRSGKAKPAYTRKPFEDSETDEKPHRKILLLTGPPGLGKTTLAHVCAMQAGYEIMEINASDERSSNVVKGRIKTTVGTESVKTVGTTMKNGQAQKMARPVCVVVDEVDGVVSGSGGSGEGGFIKALIDLIQLDAKNDNMATANASNDSRRKKKGDNFRLLRPLILICNDVYHPSLRPLRQSSFAEVIHIRKPPMEAVVARMKSVFEKEGVACDGDGVRKLCEATWGLSSGPDTGRDANGTGEGDLRSLLVVGEWVAGKLKASAEAKPKLTRKWVEQNMLSNLSHGGGGARGVGRGGVKEVVSRVFLLGAGFPKAESQAFAPPPMTDDKAGPRHPRTLHASEIAKRAGMDRLREMVDTSGDIDRIVTDIFSAYPSQHFNDDTVLSKPDSAYEWLHFHDACSSRVYSDQDWELMPYLSQPVLACHELFASPARPYSVLSEQKKWNNEDAEGEQEKEIPFSGPRADYDAREAEKSYRSTIQELQSSMNAALLRSFRSPEDIATDLLPYLVRMLTPDVKPIIVGGSGDQRGIASVRKEGEREMVRRAVNVMSGFDVKYERGKLEGDFASRGTQWVYRMEPPLDTLVEFPTASTGQSSGMAAPAPVRYAVRQVLDQEYQKNLIVRSNAARQARYRAGGHAADEGEAAVDHHRGLPHPTSTSPANRPGLRDRALHPEEPLVTVRKDFFGRVLADEDRVSRESDGPAGPRGGGEDRKKGRDDNKVWVSFHEGFSNAVRKPVTVDEILRGL